MEMSMRHKQRLSRTIPRWCVLGCLLAISYVGRAQQATYSISDERMVIKIDMHIDKIQLAHFINQYGLQDLDLENVMIKEKFDKLRKKGWRVDLNNGKILVLSKKMLGLLDMADPGKRMEVTEEHPTFAERFPAVNDNLRYGFNRFVNKHSFATQDSFVTFYMRGVNDAHEVLLAGSFTNWQSGAIHMNHTDSGWIARVKLGSGKYWYKFIVDGGWTIDNDNDLNEDDGQGNRNSVYYKTNTKLTLAGHTDARKAYLAGSFNGWKSNELPMTRVANGWQIELYLADGTHTYKFVVNGEWIADPTNKNTLPDGDHGFNSVLAIGKAHLFMLQGHADASEVIVAGDFNEWRPFELHLKRTSAGWELPYVLGPGNYTYKFRVDGRWINDPGNPLFINRKDDKASYLIIGANYTFRLSGYDNAHKVYLAGDFNNWTPDALLMKRSGEDWIFHIHLSIGKHLYKFIVDGQWIKDPGNQLWEENEFGTDNSVIWIEH
jgi:hypothetical protein